MPIISGTAFLMASSIPAFSVIRLMGHAPHAPSSLSLTILSGVISSTETFPPSVSKYGRIVSKAASTCSNKLISLIYNVKLSNIYNIVMHGPEGPGIAYGHLLGNLARHFHKSCCDDFLFVQYDRHACIARFTYALH